MESLSPYWYYFAQYVFLNTYKGLGAYLWNHNDFKLGFAIGYTFGRDEDDSNYLKGLGDIDGGITANILLEWAVGDIAIDARYEEQITGQDTGFQVHLGLGYDLRIAKEKILRPSVKATYANSDYMEEYFSISPIQATRSGLSAYDAASGFKSWQTIAWIDTGGFMLWQIMTGWFAKQRTVLLYKTRTNTG